MIYTRVYVSQLPIGITKQEIRDVFAIFENIHTVDPILRRIQGKLIDTGDRVISYVKVDQNIPHMCSYTAGEPL